MVSYIRAEFYKVLHRKYTYWFLFTMLAGAALLVAGWVYANANGNEIGFYNGASIMTILLSIGVYAPLLTGDLVFSDQYKYNTLKNEVSYGVPRIRIYLGKLLVSCIVAVVLCAIIIGFYLGMCWLVLPHDPVADGEAMQLIGAGLLNALPLWLGGQAVSIFCLSVFKSSNMAAFAYIGVLMFVPAVFKMLAMLIDPIFMTLRSYMLIAPFDVQSVPGDWAFFGKCCIIGVGWFAASTLAGLFAMKKREIN